MKLKRGYTFNFRNSTWKVTEVYQINWEDGTKSDEYKVKSEQGILRYLEIFSDNSNQISYSFWVKEFDHDFLHRTKIKDDNFISIDKFKFPKKLNLKGVKYEYTADQAGNCHYGITNLFEKERVDSINYENQNGSRLLSIEIWDHETEISVGTPIDREDLKNIEKGKPPITTDLLVNWGNKYLTVIILVVYILVSMIMSKCNQKKSWDYQNSDYQNDTTKVYRSNNYYRGRTSSGFGK